MVDEFLANLNLGRMWTVTLNVSLESIRMCWKWVGDSMGGDAIRRFLFERERPCCCLMRVVYCNILVLFHTSLGLLYSVDPVTDVILGFTMMGIIWVELCIMC